METWNSLNTTLAVFTRTYSYLRRSKRAGADIERLKLDWARETLESVGVRVTMSGTPHSSGPLILVGNHISYLDIPLLMLTSPGVSFLAKSEIQHWPVIGHGAKTIGTTFVKRENKAERASARRQIGEAVQNHGKIALFPSGTTSVQESKPWRHGAFTIAEEFGVKVQPFRIRYSPLRTAAYIDRDFFPLHLFWLARCSAVEAAIEFHEPVEIVNAAASCEEWRRWCGGTANVT